MPKEPLVLVSLRIPRTMKDELDRLAADAGSDRSAIGRRMWADGIRRARIAARYTTRLAGPPRPGPRAREHRHQEESDEADPAAPARLIRRGSGVRVAP